MTNKERIRETLKCKCGTCTSAAVPEALVKKIEDIEHVLGSSITISSGVRCADWNARQGGKPTSSHTKGCAVDVRVKSNHEMYTIVAKVMAYGMCTRIGVYTWGLHLDWDYDKMGEVLWVGKE